jgi:hypothetical protein
MKITFALFVMCALTGCGLECVEKKTGLHRASSTIEDSKEKGVFQFEMQPEKLSFLLDSGRIFEIKKAWVEYSWTYQCIEDKAVVTKDDFMQVVIETNKRPHSITQVDYAILEKGTGAFLSSTNLDFSYNNQDTVILQLVKFKGVLDSNKIYFDKIRLTKKISR